MAEVINIARRFYNAGTEETPPSPVIDPAHSRVRITLTRDTWPATLTLTFHIYYSTNGVDWRRIASATAEGGVIYDADNNEIVVTRINIPMPVDEIGLTTRQLKVVVSISERFRTSVLVESL